MYSEGQSIDDFDMPLVQYLALDIDIRDLKIGITPKSNLGLLNYSEFHHMVVKDPKKLSATPYITREWMPKQGTFDIHMGGNIYNLNRASARLGLIANFQEIKSRILNKVKILNSIPNEPLTPASINVVFCFSVSGATGSGSFIDMAYLVKDCLNMNSIPFHSSAYLILPEIFDKVIANPLAKKRIWGNSYAALRELDFFMQEKYNRDIELLEDNKMTIPVKGPPFDIVRLISNTTSNGTTCQSIPNLMELIGSSMVLHNLCHRSALSFLSVHPLVTPRYVGIGYAELRYDTELVSKYYNAKISSVLCGLIIDSNNRESEVSLEQKVCMWRIKEDEADDLIDQLLPPYNSFTHFVLDGDGYSGTDSRSTLESNAEAHLSNQIQILKKKSAANLQELTSRVIPNIINDFVNSVGCILDKGGIITAIDAIEKLLAEPFVTRYAFQMSDEIENNYSTWNDGIETGSAKGVKHYIKTIEKRIQEELKGLSKAQDSIIFTRKGNCMPIIESLVSSYNKLLDYNSQKIKREDAKQFYAKLIAALNKTRTRLVDLQDNIARIKNGFEEEKDAIKTMSFRQSNPFSKAIHPEKIKADQVIAGDDINLQNFLNLTKINLFEALSTGSLKKAIKNFVLDTKFIRDINKQNITSYLKEVEKNDIGDVQRIFGDIKNTGQPLLIQPLPDTERMEEVQLSVFEGSIWGIGAKNDVYNNIKNIVFDPELMQTDDHSIVMFTTCCYPVSISSIFNLKRYKYDYDAVSIKSYDVDRRLRVKMDEESFELL